MEEEDTKEQENKVTISDQTRVQTLRLRNDQGSKRSVTIFKGLKVDSGYVVRSGTSIVCNGIEGIFAFATETRAGNSISRVLESSLYFLPKSDEPIPSNLDSVKLDDIQRLDYPKPEEVVEGEIKRMHDVCEAWMAQTAARKPAPTRPKRKKDTPQPEEEREPKRNKAEAEEEREPKRPSKAEAAFAKAADRNAGRIVGV